MAAEKVIDDGFVGFIGYVLDDLGTRHVKFDNHVDYVFGGSDVSVQRFLVKAEKHRLLPADAFGLAILANGNRLDHDLLEIGG